MTEAQILKQLAEDISTIKEDLTTIKEELNDLRDTEVELQPGYLEKIEKREKGKFLSREELEKELDR
jgi:hypothetical protein